MIRLLIVDDSVVARTVLSEIFRKTDDIEVVGTAVDPYDARDKIKELNPYVITLDVEMPRMNGLVFLENLMRLRPMPVVMVSTLTAQGAETTLKALELGAIDFAHKPSEGVGALASQELIQKVRTAAQVERSALLDVAHRRARMQKAVPGVGVQSPRRLTVVAASTGGPAALYDLLGQLPPDFPPILVVQHLQDGFDSYFAARLSKSVPMEVVVAEHRMVFEKGKVYLAPNGSDMVIHAPECPRCRLVDPLPGALHQPSADRLFASAAATLGKDLVGVLLTGMGKDGVAGLGKIKEAGGVTLVQDQQSSVVWGMPGAAVAEGFAGEVHSIQGLATRLRELFTAP